ncbi:LicD family protein [Schaedlerella arabinosiphila]|uniref:LicD family protein n=1 Tax=Schaedlerella arabinosiphila TaxID=2044587 RepID=A0A9X5H4M6_9FIRM|nr:LicD family protein [Schaedlerella arabinosiphila]KAI4443319.1 hypothetical protein C824_005854 [Schaedlerella arabinosiphila]NDO68947.1 LicD family protein [Schaedlerella arabinosiphila]
MIEKRNGKELSIEEVHESLKQMLRIIDSTCKENGIIYFLSGGTAIGAIREKGIIPWDDDMDIMLPREDYEKLIVLLEDKREDYFKVYSLHDKTWNRPYSCYVDERTYGKHELVDYSHLGVTLDILPLDGLPKNSSDVKKYYKRLRVIYALYYSSLKVNYAPEEKMIFLKKIVSIFTKLIGAHRLCTQIDNRAKRLSFNVYEYVGCSVLIHFMEKEWFRKEWFKNQVFVPFEDAAYPVMNGFDEYLTALYGDYMKRPACEGNPDHHTSYFWKMGSDANN